jgi:hypothetical protein
MDETERQRLATLFHFLADHDFRGASALYDELARAAAGDPEILSLLLPAAPADRFPHLLFAAVQYLLLGEGADPRATFGSDPFPVFRRWCLDRRDDIERLTASRVNQTNEVGRGAALAPTLAVVAAAAGRPLALVEIGTSAGLNLLFDRYRYDYGDGLRAGPADSPVVVRARLHGTLAPPTTTPEVAWRVGLDRKPVDVLDDDAVRWLRSCIWPEQRHRIDLFEQAVGVARTQPPRLVTGDAVDDLAALAATAPPDAALCVFHTAMLPYLPDPARLAAVLHDVARRRPVWWVSGEVPGLVAALDGPHPDGPADDRLHFRYGIVPLGIAGRRPRTLGHSGAHGAWLEWLDPDTAGAR